MRELFFMFVAIGIIGCSSQYNKSFQTKIKTEKSILKENVEKVLSEFGINNYSIVIIYQENPGSFNNVVSDQIITRRFVGEADFSDSIYKPKNLDGFWEEKEYVANYTEKQKGKEKRRFGYFSVIIAVENFEKEKINKLNAFMNLSVANTNRNDIINVVSKKNFE